ncbi:MAG TPA: heme lyase CcmF/NrfE family subunit [Aquabacterium sp.]|uniref:heme lyase CcmF/NrfE family subunit n=1 Tax=Aquabacterium sp. TaxID=1872578 RepID=UPI002E370313|nr:heme lyase CcmF/NrfE family subunit [Aquabacterium sp.]HEX5355584.1 heme lyase CcmF/NrfE family subunit [Aquabacterium sp.]
MIPELGQIALVLALAVSMLLSAMPLWGAYKNDAALMGLARPLARVLFVLIGGAFIALMACFIRNDFSVLYVASNSNSALPLPYRIAGVWGGHEGSLLLWVMMLAFWMLAVAQFSQHLPQAVLARILAVMGMISFGFLLFMLATSNPFERLLPMALDGRDLNPLLQDPGMVAHPPMLYMGYVGFSVAFAFSIAALLGGQLDANWARWTRPWTIAAWICLTIGIMLGSVWAYYELGWGGWWFWDPVENASFMPWLAGTALMHSLAVTEKRGSFKNWTVLLAITAFSLSLLGTFLVRSGVLSSVHAFATDPRRGLFILTFLVLVIGSSLTLYAWRAPTVGLGQRFGLVSKESMLLANNVLLIVAMGSVLLGTLYPLFLDAMGLGKISVGPPYFDTVFVPLMTPLVFLMGVGPLARWKQAELPDLAVRLRWALAASVVAALATQWLAGKISLGTSIGLWMAFWIVGSIIVDLHEKGWRKIPLAMAGMIVAHLGVAAFAFGVSMVRTYETERDVKMKLHDTTEVGGYVFQLQNVLEVQGPNFVAARGEMLITRDGKTVSTLYPEKRIYKIQSNPMTEAAIDAGITRDLYVSMGEQLETGEWIIRVYHKPFVDWIWGGCLIMAIGGMMAASDRRYRARKPAERTTPAATGATV